jgi:HAD superfamily phosphoserine phosphatase-like hydrolase
MTGPTPERLAIYDLDRTVLQTPTFTLFLIWAAWRTAPWRLMLLPVLAILLLGNAIGLYSRDAFKPAAIALMIGRRISRERADVLATEFAAWRVPADVPPGAWAAIARDRGQGYHLLLATAAPEFYAGAIAQALGFDDVVASRHRRGANESWLAQMDGTNCYGDEKARRVTAWIANRGLEPGHVRVYSDHASDAPVFAIADEAFLVGRGAKSERIAAAHGWHIVDFRVNSTPTDVDDQRISSA